MRRDTAHHLLTMQLAANAPAAFSIMHIESSKLVGLPFKSASKATKAAWKLGGDSTGLNHDVVGLDAAGRAWEIEVYPHSDRENPTGYILTRLIGAPVKAARSKRAQ